MSDGLEFDKLVDQFHGPLYRFAFSLTGTEADASDLVQETFYIWVRKGGQLLDPGKVKSWLFTTLHREFLQARRRSARFPHVELSDAEPELPGLDPEAAERLDGGRVIEALRQVDEAFQAPVALFYLEDCPYAEIAAILGVPLGTVKSRLARGLAQLRQILAKDLAWERKEPGE